MLATVLWLLVALLAVLIAVGATPVTFRVQISRYTQMRVLVHLSLFDGRTPWILVADSGRPRGSKHRAHPPRERPPPRRQVWRTRMMLAASKDLAISVLAHIRFLEFKVRGRFGTGDPAETGEIYGLLTPLIYAAGPLSPTLKINIEPVFDGTCFEGQIAGKLKVVPFELVPPLARATWRIGRA